MTRGDRFRTTRWSLVVAASDASTPESSEALSSLCRAYWYPLYAFVRRQGYRKDEAGDLTQSYFLELLEKGFLKDAEPSAGKFRSFLLATLKHFLSHERDKQRAQKRGGGTVTIPIDTESAERLYREEPAEGIDAERMYERRWAWTVIGRARARLRDQFDRAGKLEHFDALNGYLTGETEQRSYREVGVRLGISESGVKVAVLRMRRRFGESLRAEIADTVASDADVDGEVRYLLSVVGES